MSEEHQRLVNQTHSLPHMSKSMEQDERDKAASKKKKITIAAIVGILLLAATVTMILVLHKSDDDPIPVPDDNNPFDFVEFNPIAISQQDFLEEVWMVNGVLDLTTKPSNKEIAQSYKRLQKDSDSQTMTYKTVEPDQVPTGINNMVATQVAFNLTLINNYQARIQIGAVGGNNYSVPNETSPRNVEEFEARFTMLGLEMA